MQNVLTGFLLRWGSEVGGIATILVGLYMAASPSDQAAIQAILTGQGGGLSLNTYIGLAIYAFARWKAYRATVQVQAVTADGIKVTPKAGSTVEAEINQVAVGVQPKSLKPTLWERLTGKAG